MLNHSPHIEQQKADALRKCEASAFVENIFLKDG